MQMTLLYVVNKYLDYTDGFTVSDIDDTIESQQVASIAEKVYYDLYDDVFNNDKIQNLVQLESLADNTKPNYMKLPENASRVKESVVMYDISTDVAEIESVEIQYMPPLDFLEFVGTRKVDADKNEIVTDFSGYRMVIQNKEPPQYYTDFDDEHLVFDAYDSDVDSVLQSSKSGVLISQIPTFTVSSTYVIDLPEWFHTTYLNEVMSEASIALREEPLFSVARKAKIGILKGRKKQRIGTSNRERRNYGR